jgi:hypothetical protein
MRKKKAELSGSGCYRVHASKAEVQARLIFGGEQVMTQWYEVENIGER